MRTLFADRVARRALNSGVESTNRWVGTCAHDFGKLGSTMRLACLVLLARPLKANIIQTFVISGTYQVGSMSGTTTFDETTNTMVSVNINYAGVAFTSPGGFGSQDH